MARQYDYDYFYGGETEQDAFFRLPKQLIYDQFYCGLSSDAKILYAIMLDRMNLSLKNGWKDQQGRYYITFPIDAVIAAIHCAREKANKLLKELESIGLLDRKRRGQGKANLLYLKHLACDTTQAQPEGESVPLVSQCKTEAEPVSPAPRSSKIELQEVRKPNFKKFGNRTSRSLKTEHQEVRKSNCNKTDFSKTDFSKTDSIINQASDDAMERVKAQISYDSLCTDPAVDKQCLDSLVAVLSETLQSNFSSIRVNRCTRPAMAVKEKLYSLQETHIRFVLQSWQKNKAVVRNVRQYILTALYNAPDTIALYQSQRATEKDGPSYDLDAYERESWYDTMESPDDFDAYERENMYDTMACTG